MKPAMIPSNPAISHMRPHNRLFTSLETIVEQISRQVAISYCTMVVC